MDKRDLSTAFRSRLTILVQRSGLSQSAYAGRIGIDRSALSQLLAGIAPRLPRAEILVLAGAIMGGEITDAVRDLQSHGIKVVALNMVGSVREAADLVVGDPLQAGVMAVMAIANTARFDITRQKGRVY